MTAVANWLARSPNAPRMLRLLLQALVSMALISLLIRMGRLEDLSAAWQHAGPGVLLLACGCFAVAAIFSARRWQMFLRYQGVDESLPRLFAIYGSGLFCSLFLPTAAGGDAYRVFAIAKRGWPAASVFLATLQERLLGLGGAMLVGLVAAVGLRSVLPENVLATVFAVFPAGIGAVAVVLYLGVLWTQARRRIDTRRFRPAKARLLQWGLAARVAQFVRPLREAPGLNLSQAARVLFLALATFAAAVAMHAVVCNAVDAECSPLTLCLVVSLVGVVRMLPISLNGIGVGETAFVYLMGLFGVDEHKAVPVALVVLAVSTAMSLLGGTPLLWHMLFAVPGQVRTAEPAALAFPRSAKQGGAKRHAA